MYIRQRYIIGSIFLIITASAQSQSIRNHIKDDRQKSLLEQIKPSRVSPLHTPVQSDADAYKSYKDLNTDTESRRKHGIDTLSYVKSIDVSPYLKNIGSDIIVDVGPEPGSPIKTMVVDGKTKIVPVADYELEQKLDQLSQRHRLQGAMINYGIGGLNLSGFKKKKMSKKAKDILEQVFGMQVEEN